MTSVSRLDTVYRSFLLSKFFTKGWGNPKNMKRLFEFRRIISDREQCKNLVSPDYPIIIDKVEDHSSYKLMDGHFLSPLVHYLPEVVPPESATARFQVVLSKNPQNNGNRPMCIHLAGTGDHYFWRRRTLLAKPLLKESGVSSIILENPFYGTRKPESQQRSNLHNVSDIFVMGGCLILESLALLHWCEKEGLGPLGLTGISMGGHMASLAACNWHKPISLIPCLSWTTASHVFTQGVMSGAIPWSLLQSQYFSDHIYNEELLKMIHSPEENSDFRAGYHFSSTFPSSFENFNLLMNGSPPPSPTATSQAIPNPANDLDAKLENNYNTYLNFFLNQASKFDSVKSKLPKLPFSNGEEDAEKSPEQKEFAKRAALNFMRGIMDECTHMGNFSTPIDPSLIVIVAAKNDGYVPREGIKSLPELWPGCEVRYLDCGHIAAFLLHQAVFRKAIVDALNRNAEKYMQQTVYEESNS